jgi:hypothetical protein
MGAERLTRRSLLAAGAGALGALGRVPSALGARGDAADAPGQHTGALFEQPVGLLGPGVSGVALDRLADLIALQWDGPLRACVELRFRSSDGAWSPWCAAGAAGHDDASRSATATTVGEPIWTGGTTAIQLRTRHALRGVRLHLIDVSGGAGAARLAAHTAAPAATAATELAQPVLNAGPGQPPIIARSVWTRGECPPSQAPGYGAVELAFVHHTQSPNGYSAGEVGAMLRAIYVFHRSVRGWHDIGYNFAIDRFGRAFEARAGGIDESVVGAQAGGYNVYSTGIALLGSFMSSPISSPARRTLEALLAWKLSLHGVPVRGSVVVQVDPAGAAFSKYPAGSEVSLPRIAGHRDADSTDCPGDALYRELPGIRARALAQSGNPVQATIALQSAPVPPPAGGPAPTATEAQLLGTLTLLDGTPLPGETVTVQARSVYSRGQRVLERPLAQVVTNGEGQWTLPAGPATARRRWVRASFEGSGAYGAAVSEGIRAPFTPSTPAA